MTDTRSVKWFGWRPDTPDFRDHVWSAPRPRKLPDQASLRMSFPPCYDQKELGSCTGNAIAAALEYDRRRQNLRDFVPSRLMIYWMERYIEGTVNEDAGAEIRDGIRAVSKWGACDETLWPYDINNFRIKPPAAAYRQAKETQAVRYSRVSQTKDAIKATIASGFPIVFGFAVYESFESDDVSKTGLVPMPKPTEKQVGGHAVLLVGYDDTDRVQRFECRNSWGTDWGINGYFTMPMAYVLDSNLADDLWVVRSVG